MRAHRGQPLHLGARLSWCHHSLFLSLFSIAPAEVNALGSGEAEFGADWWPLGRSRARCTGGRSPAGCSLPAVYEWNHAPLRFFILPSTLIPPTAYNYGLSSFGLSRAKSCSSRKYIYIYRYILICTRLLEAPVMCCSV